MTIRRSAAAVGAVALGLFALSACTKPTPLATVTVGTNSVSTEAACYNDGKPLSQPDFLKCLAKTPDTTMKVKANDRLHIGVDPAIAKKGWILAQGATPKTERITDTYRTYNAGQLFVDSTTGQSTKTAVLNFIESSGNQDFLGVWQVKLELVS